MTARLRVKKIMRGGSSALLLIGTNYLTAVTITLLMDFNAEASSSTVTVQPNPSPRLNADNKVYWIKEIPIDVEKIPDETLRDPRQQIQRFTHTDDGDFFFITKEGDYQPIVYKNSRINEIKSQPVWGEKAGFMYYPNGDHISEVALVIMDVTTKEAKEVYRNDVRTSSWEWDGPKRVIVYYNCGTACLYAYKIDIATGERVDEYHVITDYSPPPNT